LLLTLLCPQLLLADEIRVFPVENFSTAFAGDEVAFEFRVAADESADGTLLWSHSAEQRTLNRGEAAVQRQQNGAAQASFVLRLPDVRGGIIYPTTIAAEFVPQGKNSAVAMDERTLWLFPRQPLAARRAWAEKIDLELIDHEGTTDEALESIGLPFHAVRTVSAVRKGGESDESNQNRILLVGEGMSLGRGTLIDAAVEAARAGRRIVVLAPQDGAFEMPGLSDDVARGNSHIEEVRFVRHSVIREFDKRLDVTAWIGAGNHVPIRGLHAHAVRGRVLAEVIEGDGWPWLEMRYPETGGVLIVCGFRIIEHWEHGPTPRYLLVRMLESLVPFKAE